MDNHEQKIEKATSWLGAAIGAEKDDLGIASKKLEEARLFQLWWTQYSGKEISEGAFGISKFTASVLFLPEVFKELLERKS